ncbi:MAG TPA: beta-ketoacyl-ACP synthase III [Pirellulales bacterium]
MLARTAAVEPHGPLVTANVDGYTRDRSTQTLPNQPSSQARSMLSGLGNSGRSPLRSLMGVQIVGTGSYAPDVVVTNDDLVKRLGFDADWILQRSGIHERRHSPPHMATSDLAAEAAKRCLAKSGVSPSEVDLVVVGTFTPDVLCPSTACLLQNKLGINAPAMDVQAACAGFMYALVTAAQFVATGNARYALAVGADCNSRIINPRDMRTYPLFGDGAGAVLLAAGEPHQGLVAYTLGSDGSGADLLIRRMGGSRMPPSATMLEEDAHYLEMDGRAVFKWAVRLLGDTIDDVLRPAGMTVEDVQLFIAHQANVRIIKAAADAVKLREDQLFVNLDRYGNTSAASIPLALDEALDQGRLQRGDNLLLSGFGAGLSWGTALMRW